MTKTPCTLRSLPPPYTSQALQAARASQLADIMNPRALHLHTVHLTPLLSSKFQIEEHFPLHQTAVSCVCVQCPSKRAYSGAGISHRGSCRVNWPDPRPTASPRGPAQDTQHLLSKLTRNNDIEAFLCTFEHVAHRNGWPERDLAHAITPLFIRDAQRACHALPNKEAADYTILCEEILARCGLSSSQAAS